MNFRLSRWTKPVLALGLFSAAQWALALTLQPFEPAALAQLQQAGKPVVVHFHADWCSTCQGQARALDQLKSDPQLKDHTVLIADFDKEKELRKTMKVRYQSIMVVFKGPQEVDRVNGQTRPAEIKAAFLKAQAQ